MIYLIDDNQNNQRQRLGIYLVEEDIFKGYLTSIEKIEKRKLMSDISHLDFLRNAKCILLHATLEDWDRETGFIKGSTTNAVKIKENIANEGASVPLVLFSNKEAQSDENIYRPDKNPNIINLIQKNLFYSRLYDFVSHYKDMNVIELRILAFGKNFQAIEIKRLSEIILETISTKQGDKNFVISDISGKQQIFRNFMELSFPHDSWITFLNDLEDNPIQVNEFRNKINLITESFLKYGKNICTWK